MVNKKAAMEMTMGTVVTIVLMIAMLIVVLFFIDKIRDTGTNAIDGIDEAIRTEMEKLFSDDENLKVVMYPTSRKVSMKSGDTGGFGFLIRNIEMSVDEVENTFTYEVSAGEVTSSCSMTLEEANDLIALRKAGTVIIPSGDILQNAIIVSYKIPETAPLCLISYDLNIKKNGKTYLPTITIDLTLK